MQDIEHRIQAYEAEFLKDLQRLISIPSTRDLSTKKEGAPFGKAIHDVMDVFCEISSRLGFQVEQSDGYACSAQIGEGTDYIGVLGHLDVVDILHQEEWQSDPFCLTIKDGVLYGRGVNDDKGPLLASLYAAKIVKDMGVQLRYPIRIIAGGAEETTWECMDHYFKHHPQPLCGFSPDGNFPIVNGEKGILCLRVLFPSTSDEFEVHCKEYENWVNEEIEVVFKQTSITMIGTYAKRAVSVCEVNGDIILTYQGKRAMSRNPQRGENALFAFVHDFMSFPFQEKGSRDLLEFFSCYLLDDVYGNKAGIYHEDSEMGKTSICPCSIQQRGPQKEVLIDIRFIKGLTKDTIVNIFQDHVNNYDGILEIQRSKRMLYVEESSSLIQSLKKAYCKVMQEEAEVFTKGGASYARVLDQGVAFGATFDGDDPKPHMPNENMKLEALMKAMYIYVEALIELTAHVL